MISRPPDGRRPANGPRIAEAIRRSVGPALPCGSVGKRAVATPSGELHERGEWDVDAGEHARVAAA